LLCPTKWGQGAGKHECDVLAAIKYTLHISEPGGDKVRAPLLPFITQEIDSSATNLL
jgi:hypothetical protein